MLINMLYIRYSIILTFNDCNAGSLVIKGLAEVTMPLFIAQLSLLSFVSIDELEFTVHVYAPVFLLLSFRRQLTLVE